MKSMTENHRRSRLRRVMPAIGAALLAAGFGLGGGSAVAMSPELADLNGDGVVNVLDYRLLARRNGKVSGTAGYLEGMDLVPDGVIDRTDLNSMRGEFRKTADNSPASTAFGGRVFDGLGNVLEGVKVFVGTGSTLEDLLVAPCNLPTCVRSDANGQYLLTDLPASVHGETAVSFISNEVIDPTPGQLSGEFASIPNKPAFANAGVTTVFRDVPLPERDLTGAKTVGPGADVEATPEPDGSLTLNAPAQVDNGMAKVDFPAGCNVKFPAGEPNQLSMTRVPAASLPVAMPPGLSSTIFVTYQPGGTEMNCPGGEFITEFDNVDGFPITVPGVTPPGLIPILNGIVGGVFVEIAPCVVEDRDGNGVDGDVNDIVVCTVPTPFEFAWYHTDIRPPDPCPRTTVIGQVKIDGTATPVAGATVTIPGATPVTTDDNGNFSIAGVSAGPNGPFCTTSPFSLRATASGEVSPGVGDTSVSELTPAVPGATTDLGMIFLGNAKGQVRGRVVKLERINPELVVPLPGAIVELTDAAGAVHTAIADANGNYNIDDVEIGDYTKTMNFTGDVPLPGGGTEQQTLFESQTGNVAAADIPDVNDFLLTSEGVTVTVHVQELDGTPIENAEIYLYNGGGTFGLFRVLGFVFDDLGLTDANGELVFPIPGGGQPGAAAVIGDVGIPMGPCTMDVYDKDTGDTIGHVNGNTGCFINEDGEALDIVVVRELPGTDMIEASFRTTLYETSAGVTIDVLEVIVELGQGLTPNDDGVSFLLDFDLDQNAATGGPGLINARQSQHATQLGVEVSWECDFIPASHGIQCLPPSDSAYTPIDGFFEAGSDTRIVFLLPRANANGLLGVGDAANIAIATQDDDFGGEVQWFDVLPNGDPDAVPPVPPFVVSDFDTLIVEPDPLGDTFEGFGGGPQ